MSHPAELPTNAVVGVTINGTTSANNSENNLCEAPSGVFPPSPIIQSVQASTVDFDPHLGAKPCSPFYRHNDNDSLEYLKDEATILAQRYGSNDLESGPSNTPHKRSLDIHGVRQSKLWMKKKRRCDCLSSLTKRQRLAVKLVIAFFIVGAMVGIAVGITAAVGGGVWKSHDQQGTIGG
jgi:hypothetical protein